MSAEDVGMGDAGSKDLNPEDWALLEELYHRASDLPPAERGPFLDRHCSDHPELRAQLDLMLCADEEDDRIEGAVEAGLGWVRGEPSRTPSHIGPYRVLREIGRGGIATVYLAERADDQFQMRVAIKVVRRGMDTEDILRRLRQERQILAGLNHPNIARLLDGGTTDDGVPYFVMEHIEGERIDAYCRQHSLSLEQRLKLFRAACSAVDFAHSNLVLHRDLKPSNLMVTADGVPKLLDFGIAKVLDPDDSSPGSPNNPPALTRTGALLLTPSYASPEQVLGRPLTTASDVYSLGMMLYQLLVGRLPYEINSRRPGDLERAISDATIEAPSTLLSRLDRDTLSDGSPIPGIRSKDLRGDLDTVILAALRKQPERRYSSAAALAEDLRRYLEKLPVRARRDTLIYRAGKFVRRHRLSVAAVLCVIGLLLTAVGVTLRQAQVAREALANSTVAQKQMAFQADFLIGLFELSDPWQRPGPGVSAEDVLEVGYRQIPALLKNDPLVGAELLETMGRTFQNQNRFPRARELLESSLTKRMIHFGAHSLEVAQSRRALGVLSFEEGDLLQADRLLDIARQTFVDLLGADHQEVATTLYETAGVYKASGRLKEAVDILQRVLEICESNGDDAEPLRLEALNRLAEILFQQGKIAESETMFRSVLEQRRALGEHPDLALGLNNLAVLLLRIGKIEESGQLLTEALDLRRRLFGDTHSDVAQSLYNLAMFRMHTGQKDGVADLFEQALDTHQRLFKGIHPSQGDYLHGLADFYLSEGNLEEADELFSRAIEIRRLTLGEDPLVTLSMLKLAEVAVKRNDPKRGEALYAQTLSMQRRLLSPGDRRLATTLNDLGSLYLRLERPARAEVLFREALDILTRHPGFGPSHRLTRWAEGQWAWSLIKTGDVDRGLPLMRESLESLRASPDVEPWRIRIFETRLSQVEAGSPPG